MVRDRKFFLAVALGLAAVVFILGALNKWITDTLGSLKASSLEQAVFLEPIAVKPVQARKPTGKTTKKLTLDPNRTFYLARFFSGSEEEEILQCKITAEKIYDCTAAIPDGKIEFVNQTDQTYGWQEYRRGAWDGDFKEYYDSGHLKKEGVYFLGALQTYREYFTDGVLKMEKDLTDALWVDNDPETGVGKVYYRDGTLMYEWRLTNKDRVGFKKSYNKSGQVVSVRSYDHNGQLISTKRFDPD